MIILEPKKNLNISNNFFFQQPIGFNIPSSTNANFNSTTNGFSNFNNGVSPNQGNASPLNDLDEFDIISNRNKIETSPHIVNNGNKIFLYLKINKITNEKRQY